LQPLCRRAGRLAKVQADIQAYNSVPEGQAEQVNVPALLKTREELVEALVALKADMDALVLRLEKRIDQLQDRHSRAS
jgi:hypothetical protein